MVLKVTLIDSIFFSISRMNSSFFVLLEVPLKLLWDPTIEIFIFTYLIIKKNPHLRRREWGSNPYRIIAESYLKDLNHVSQHLSMIVGSDGWGFKFKLLGFGF